MREEYQSQNRHKLAV